MKKSILIAAILALAVTAGCAKTNVSDTAGSSNVTASDKATDDKADNNSENEQSDANPNDFAKNANENVDMDAIEGEYLQVSDEAVGSPSQKMGVYEVTIKEAKTFELDGGDYVVFTIDFKNNSSVEATFSSTIEALAFQDGLQIAPASLPTQIEGLDTTTTAQRVPGGDKITVQKLFALSDATAPVEIQLRAFHENTDAIASQIFDIQ